MKTKRKVWSSLREIANSEPDTEEGETEKGMAIAALYAVYRYLMKKGKKSRVGVTQPGSKHKKLEA